MNHVALFVLMTLAFPLSANAFVTGGGPEHELRIVDGGRFPDCPTSNSNDVPYSADVVRTQEVGLFSFGVAAVRPDPDGDEVLLLSNGLDLAPQPLVAIPAESNEWPTWYSRDFDFQGRVSIGDIDGNRYPELAVPVFADKFRQYSGGALHIYANKNGTLSPEVAQTIEVGGAVLEASFGDADADGDLDLVTSVLGTSGLLPGPPPSGSGPTIIFRNSGGKIESQPYWTSGKGEVCEPGLNVECNFVFGLIFADVNQDGIMDLVANGNRLRIYNGYLVDAGKASEKSAISGKPSWESSESWAVGYDVSMGWHDFERRELMLAVSSYSTTNSGAYPFRVYTPSVSDTVAWSSEVKGLGGGLLLHDLDADGRADLVAASQGLSKQPLRIYMGHEDGFDTAPQYCSGSPSGSAPRTILCGQSLFLGGTVVVAEGKDETVVEKACERFVMAGSKYRQSSGENCSITVLKQPHAGYVFTLKHKATDIESVKLDNKALPQNQIAFARNSMTVAVGKKVRPAATLEIVYKYLARPNVVIADMDPLCGPGIMEYQD